MATRTMVLGCLRDAAKAALVASMCVSMAAPEAFAAAPAAGAGTPSTPHLTALTRDQKALHALNRFTFGPRPGDETAVEKQGLDAWFQKQLHPATIDDSAFEARMAQFPALKLTQAELMKKFPPPGVMRQMARSGRPLPTDPVEHAIYADSMANYELQLQIAANAGLSPALRTGPGAANGGAGNGGAGNGGAADGMSAAAQAPAAQAPMQGRKRRLAAQQAAAAQAAASTEMAAGAPAAAGEPGMEAPAEAAMNDGMASTGAAPAANTKKKAKVEAPAMTQAEMTALLALPPEERFAKFVAMSPEQMVSFRKGMRGEGQGAALAGLTPEQREDVMAMQGGIRVIAAEALSERMLRDVYSERQLQAVMDDFWLNHFSVYVKKNQDEPYYLSSYNRDAVLPNALGNFETLLVATAESPAMLRYLDNWESVGPNSAAVNRGNKFQAMAPNSPIAKNRPKGINENYARELMELHTVGVNCEVSTDHPASALSPACGGGYTQADVTNVAKCFTGWTIDRPYGGDGGGGFVFEASRHEPGKKVVLGHTIPESGMNEGLAVLHILATSPATAHFVSNKLAVRFVSDAPPEALVNRMATTFVKTHGDIAAVMATMYHSPEFWAPNVYRAKVKTPIEFMASALRASDTKVLNPVPLVQAMEQLGMPIYGMQTPNGYSWLSDEWVSSNALVSRMNFALVLSGGRVPGAVTNWPMLLGDSDDSPVATSPTAATELQLEALILGQSAASHTRASVLEEFKNPLVASAAENFAKTGPPPSDDSQEMAGAMVLARGKNGDKGAGRGNRGFQPNRPETPLDTMAGLLLGSPDFQRR